MTRYILSFCLAFGMFLCGCQSDPAAKETIKPEEIVKATTETVATDTSMLAENQEKEEEAARIAAEEEEKAAAEKAEKEAKAKAKRKKIREKKKKLDAESKKKRAAEKAKASAKAQINFEQSRYNFGTIKQGDKINYAFKFTNTGKKDLVIDNATATCGCTQPGFPFLPIPPGKTGEITVTYNSTGKLGPQKPTITVTSNAGTKKLQLDGMVLPKEKPTATTTVDPPKAPETMEVAPEPAPEPKSEEEDQNH